MFMRKVRIVSPLLCRNPYKFSAGSRALKNSGCLQTPPMKSATAEPPCELCVKNFGGRRKETMCVWAQQEFTSILAERSRVQQNMIQRRLFAAFRLLGKSKSPLWPGRPTPYGGALVGSTPPPTGTPSGSRAGNSTTSPASTTGGT